MDKVCKIFVKSEPCLPNSKVVLHRSSELSVQSHLLLHLFSKPSSVFTPSTHLSSCEVVSFDHVMLSAIPVKM